MTAPTSSVLGPVDPPAGGTQGGALQWSSRHVADAVGVTYRQLDYWVSTGRLVPSARAEGTRRYLDPDFELAAALRDLFALGCRHELLTSAVETVRHARVRPGEWLVVTVAGHAVRCGPTDVPRVIHRPGAPHGAWLVPLTAFDKGRAL